MSNKTRISLRACYMCCGRKEEEEDLSLELSSLLLEGVLKSASLKATFDSPKQILFQFKLILNKVLS